MGLGDKSLAAGFMNQTYGGASTMDEQEIIRMRSSPEDTSGLEDAYGRTGNMRVARTLAKYQNGGRMFQDGGKIIKGKDGDPYEYKEENGVYYARKQGDTSWDKSEGNAADTIKKRYFPANAKEDNAVVDDGLPRNDGKGGLNLQDDFTGPRPASDREISEANKRFEEEQKPAPFEKIGTPNPMEEQIKKEVEDKFGNTYKRWAPKIAEDYGELTEVEEPPDYSGTKPPKPAPERYVGPDQVAPGTGGTGGTGATSPVGPEVRTLDRPQIGNLEAPVLDTSGIKRWDPSMIKTPTAGPTWWDENAKGINRGASNVAAGLLNIAPALGNIKRYNSLPGVPAANLAQAQLTRAPSMDAGRQAIIAQGQNAANRAEGASSSDQLAASIAAMGGTQSALSQYAGQEAQVVAQNDARNAQAVNATNARNVGILNQQSQQEQARDMYQIRGIANEWGNVANKSLGFLGDMNRQKLDREKMDLTRQRYNVYDQLDRAALKQFEETGVYPSGYRTPGGRG